MKRNQFARYKYILLSCIAFIFFSCTTTKEITGTFSRDNVLNLIHHASPAFSTLKGDGDISVETPAQSFSGSFEIAIKNPDSLLLHLYGPFGISVATLQLSRDSIHFYNAMENQLINASFRSSSLENIINFSGDFETIVNLFSGNLPSSPSETSLFFQNENEIALTQSNSEGDEKFWFLPDVQMLGRYVKSNKGLERIYEEEHKRFETIDERTFPYWIRAKFPEQRRSITIAYDKVELNKNVSCFYSIPKKAEIINK